MTTAIDGLISGLDTTSMITQLMQVEAAPQSALKVKQTSAKTYISALQSLNAKVASLGEAAAKAAKPASWAAFTATSSATSASATTSSTAQAGSVTFSVDAVATTQMSLSVAVPDDGTLASGTTPSLTVKKQDGTLVTVAAASSSLADLAAALNSDATTGVTATVVQVSGGTTPTYRLQVSGTQTGSTGTFELYDGADDTGPRLDSAQVRAAQDATITLWKGTGVEQSFTQPSNTFVGLMSGVDVTVSKVTAATEDPVTISVAQDSESVAALAQGLVEQLGVALSEIASRTASTTTTRTDGTTLVSGGLLSGDSAVRSAQQSILSAASLPAGGRSPSEVGMVIGRDGTITFDADTFAAALAADPAKVQSMVSEIAGRVATVADTLSDKTTGIFTMKVTGQESLVKDYGTQIESWDVRLALRRAALEKTYAALEVSLSNLNAQSSWLTSQLDSLSANSSS